MSANQSSNPSSPAPHQCAFEAVLFISFLPSTVLTHYVWLLASIRKHRDLNLAIAFQTATSKKLKAHVASPLYCTSCTQHLTSAETHLQPPSPRSEFAACCSLHEHSTPARKAQGQPQHLGELLPYLRRGSGTGFEQALLCNARLLRLFLSRSRDETPLCCYPTPHHYKVNMSKP